MKRGRRKTAVRNLVSSVNEELERPAGRRTRSQSAKDQNREIISIGSKTDEESNFVSNLHSKSGASREFYREGSHDSAISSDSSKWSLSSRISLTSCTTVKSLLLKKGIISDVTEEPESNEIKKHVKDDSYIWQSNISHTKIRSAVPTVRSGQLNGHVIRKSASCTREVSKGNDSSSTKIQSDVVSSNVLYELLMYLGIFINTASMMSTETYVKSLLTEDIPQIANPLLLQVMVYLFIGISFDLVSPMVALIISPIMSMGVCIFTYIKPSQVALPYLKCLTGGFLGSQLFGVHCQQFSKLEKILTRIGLVYGLAVFLYPEVIMITTSYLRAPFNCLLFAMASLLCMCALPRLMTSSFRPYVIASTDDKGFSHFFCFCMLKLFLTIPTTQLLGAFQEILKGCTFLGKNNFPFLISAGFLTIQAVVTPILTLFTSPIMSIVCVAAMLTVIYPTLMVFFDGFTAQLLIAVIPLCGMVGVAQVIILAMSVNSFPRHKGTVLATSLIIHILGRFIALQLPRYLLALCTVSDTTHLISLNPFQWVVQVFQLETVNISGVPINLLFCDNIHLEALALIGCVCSAIFLVLGLLILKYL